MNSVGEEDRFERNWVSFVIFCRPLAVQQKFGEWLCMLNMLRLLK